MTLKNAEFLNIYILMSIYNLMLSWAEHEKYVIILAPGIIVDTNNFSFHLNDY